jgi:hypothetical protein
LRREKEEPTATLSDGLARATPSNRNRKQKHNYRTVREQQQARAKHQQPKQSK